MRSTLFGMRNCTWRPMRPARVSAGSRTPSGTFVAPMKNTWSLRGLGRGRRRGTFQRRCGTTYEASASVLTKRVPMRFRNGGLSTPSITTSSWLSAPLPWPPNMPGHHGAHDRAEGAAAHRHALG